MEIDLLVLPGDGIGPEVIREAVRVLRRAADRFGHAVRTEEGLIGGAALRRDLAPLPERTAVDARRAGAVLLGAVGAPEFDAAPPERRPERGLLGLRAALGVYANLRPVRVEPALADASPLRPERVAGTDLVIVRELTGGLYYGEPRGVTGEGDARRAVDTMTYSAGEIARVARVAFRLAARRRGKVTSVDKANVLACSRLWRETVTAVGREFPHVALEHQLVDSAAMLLVTDPRRFDVILTENLFGDILSDEAAVLAGSLGLLPSASLGDRAPDGRRPGLYEPVHGSAPALAGRNLANPLGAIGSVAALLEDGFGLADEAAAVREAVSRVIANGPRTADLFPAGAPASTSQIGEAVCDAL